jgi:hypothetical protein
MPCSRNFVRRLLGASTAMKQSFGHEKQVRACPADAPMIDHGFLRAGFLFEVVALPLMR